jgi:predicted nucleic acid-binding Zn ribbon protein
MKERGTISGLAAVLTTMAADRKWTKALNRHRLFEFWGEAVGREVAAHARPQVIRGAVLQVEVTDSVWMQQLQFQKGLLLEALNRRLGEEGLADIRFVLKSCETFADPPPLPPRRPNPPDPIKLAGFDKFLAVIKDEQIRACLKRIWLAQQGRD